MSDGILFLVLFIAPFLLSAAIGATIRSLFAALIVDAVIMAILSTLFVLPSFRPIPVTDQSIMLQVAVTLYVHRLVACINHRPFIEDGKGILAYLCSKLPFQMVEWGWYTRSKKVINFLTCWWDRVSFIAVSFAIVWVTTLRGLENALGMLMMYLVAWGVYLAFIVLPVMTVESVGRLIYTLTRNDNYSRLKNWLGEGFKERQITVDEILPDK